jgi:hypothetical protein
MQRFRLLGFYIIGVLAVVGLALWGVSMRRTAADAGSPSPSYGGTVAPSTASEEPSPSGGRGSQATSAVATAGTTSVVRVSIDHFKFDPEELVIWAK